MKSTSGTRAGAGHSIWKDAIQREGAVLRANYVHCKLPKTSRKLRHQRTGTGKSSERTKPFSDV